MRGFLSRAVGLSRETFWYLAHRIAGSSYVDYYARRMDSVVTRNPDWGLNLDRRFQLDYLRKHGMTPDNTMLDFGCGALSAGLLFIEFLEAGHYWGADIAAKVLEEGTRRVSRAQLTHKKPVLVKLSSTSLSSLAGRQFDFIWAQSVFTHMPPQDVEAVLCEFRNAMHPKSVAFSTYASTAVTAEQCRFKDWYYNFRFFGQAALKAGLAVTEMPDWRHPADARGVDRLLKFVIAA